MKRVLPESDIWFLLIFSVRSFHPSPSRGEKES
jgi:hypothetical protein